MTVGCTAFKASKIPGDDLFTQHGWVITGEVNEIRDKLPPDFKLRSGYFPWVIYLDLSSDIGLDFTSQAGKDVRVLRFPVQDKQGARLKDTATAYDLQGVILLDNDEVIGAWLTYTAKDGTRLVGNPGYSLKAKDLDQVTGMKWPEYATKHSPDKGSHFSTANLYSSSIARRSGANFGRSWVSVVQTITKSTSQ